MPADFGVKVYNGTEPYLFISYKTEDQHRIRPYIQELNRRGYHIWYDNGIYGGQDYRDVIPQKIKGAWAMVLFLTQDAALSPQVDGEVDEAFGDKVPIIPVYMDIKFDQLPSGLRWCLKKHNPVNDNGSILETVDLVEAGLRRTKVGLRIYGISDSPGVFGAEKGGVRAAVLAAIAIVAVLACIMLAVTRGKPDNDTPTGGGTGGGNTVETGGGNTIDGPDKTEEADNKPDDYFDPDAVYSVGDYFFFGSYEQDGDSSNGAEPIEWRVLAVENDRALIISEYCLDRVSYHEQHDSATWAISSLRSWLNESFYNEAFTAEEQSYVLLTEVENADNPEFGTNGGSDTQDYIFCLSIAEAAAYFNNDDSRIGTSTQYARQRGAENGACWWWLRSPGNIAACAARVNRAGQVNTLGNYVDSYEVVVRPAFYISLQ